MSPLPGFPQITHVYGELRTTTHSTPSAIDNQLGGLIGDFPFVRITLSYSRSPKIDLCVIKKCVQLRERLELCHHPQKWQQSFVQWFWCPITGIVWHLAAGMSFGDINISTLEMHQPFFSSYRSLRFIYRFILLCVQIWCYVFSPWSMFITCSCCYYQSSLPGLSQVLKKS